MGKHEEALSCCEQAITLDPNNGLAYFNKGNALQGMGKYEEAIDCYDKSISIYPSYPDTYYEKGNTLKAMGRKKKHWIATRNVFV